ncbi:MAG: hypothetical protein JXP72_10235 [Coriobacteriia bacterium]|nr:hypothetical protein [Coriobacteriia bacterium]
MEGLALLFGVSVASMTLMIVVLSLAAPVLWLWMLIDSALREEWEYPGAIATSNNRLLWVLLILLTQIAAIPYFFMVYTKIKRGTVAQPPAASTATTISSQAA